MSTEARDVPNRTGSAWSRSQTSLCVISSIFNKHQKIKSDIQGKDKEEISHPVILNDKKLVF